MLFQYKIENFMNDKVLITVILLVLINLYGFIYSLFITKYNFFSNNKIQFKINNYTYLLNRLPLILFNLFVLILLNVVGVKFFHNIFLSEYNSLVICILEIVFVLFVDDFFFYILHRGMHENKYIYKKIHKIHHRANVPIPLEYIYVHPLEWMTGMIGPFIAMYLLGGISFISYCFYLIIRNVHEIHIHSGIKSSKLFKYFNLYGHNEHHDVHHSKRNGNYASTFVLWDLIFKTRIENS